MSRIGPVENHELVPTGVTKFQYGRFIYSVFILPRYVLHIQIRNKSSWMDIFGLNSGFGSTIYLKYEVIPEFMIYEKRRLPQHILDGIILWSKTGSSLELHEFLAAMFNKDESDTPWTRFKTAMMSLMGYDITRLWRRS